MIDLSITPRPLYPLYNCASPIYKKKLLVFHIKLVILKITFIKYFSTLKLRWQFWHRDLSITPRLHIIFVIAQDPFIKKNLLNFHIKLVILKSLLWNTSARWNYVGNFEGVIYLLISPGPSHNFGNHANLIYKILVSHILLVFLKTYFVKYFWLFILCWQF